MWKKKRQKFGRLLLPAVIICLSSCVRANYDNCPAYPIAGPLTAAELEKIPYNGYENTWEWLARINKLRQELELCQK